MPRFHGFRRLFRHRDPAREIDDEIGFHIDTRADDLMLRGCSREEARRRAVAEFGDRDRYKRETEAVEREVRASELLLRARSDVAHALRTLRRSPGFTATVIASLGVSIAAITTVFSVADAVLFRALPFQDSEQLVWIASIRPQRNDAPLSLPEFLDYTQRSRTVEIAAFTNWNAAMETPSQTHRLQGMRISANAFDMLGIAAPVGRLLQSDDDRVDAARVVVLSHGFWQDEFGGAATVVGQIIRLNGQQHQVVGVLPRYFPLPLRDVQVVVPLQPDLDPRRNARNSVNFLRLFGRVRPSESIGSVRQDLGRIADALRADFPAEYATKLGIAVTPMQEFLVGDTRRTFVVMLGASGLLLVIALANVLNLLLIRGTARKGEIALRRALGGTARHLAGAAASEAAVLAVAGAVLGALLSSWLVWLVSSSTVAVPRLEEARVAGRTLLFVTGVSVLATLLFSVTQLGPALRTAPKEALAAIGRGQRGSRGETRLRSLFLVAQLGLAVLITVVTATMARSFARLQSLELGFRPDSVFVGMVSLPSQKYRTTGELTRFTQAFEDALRATPGVSAAGVIHIAPLSGILASVPFSVVGRAPEQTNERLNANFRAISPGYFATIGARVRAGRDFTRDDTEGSLPATIVSRAFAERYLGGGDPLGQQVLVNDNNQGPRPLTIVGVVENMRHVTIDGAPAFDIYIPMAQVHRDGLEFAAGRQFWAVRTGGGAPASFHRTFGRVLSEVDKDVALARVQPMRAYVDDALSARRLSVFALLGFASVALLLSVTGVYGAVAYSVEQRRREIGLRLALGAGAVNVARVFIVPAIAYAFLGVAGGSAGAWLTRQLVSGLLFGVSPTEPWIMTVVSVALVATSVLAAAIPARRATRIAPATALAGE